MRKCFIRRFACFCFVSFLLASMVPYGSAVEALPGDVSGGSMGGSVIGIDVGLELGDFATYLIERNDEVLTTSANWLKNRLLSMDDVCPKSPETNGRHKFVKQHTQVGSGIGDFYICNYCGKSGGEAVSEAYNSYVSDLPATGISSDGGLRWTPTLSDVSKFMAFSYSGGRDTTISWSSSQVDLATCGFSVSTDCWQISPSGSSALSFSFMGVYGRSVHVGPYSSVAGYLCFIAPVDGFYKRLEGQSISGYYIDGSSVKKNFVSNWSAGQKGSFFKGDIISFPSDVREFSNAYAVSALYEFPTFEVTVVTPVTDSSGSEVYSLDSRAGSLTGDFGIIGDNGEIIKADTTSIVNETDNSVYNPVTNTTTSYDDWSYDYSTRTYDFSKTEGDTTTTTKVRYGDESITITEGDTTYNVYYITESSGGDTPQAGHTHSYSSSVSSSPTCTMPGTRTYTCSGCGDSYTESIAALGHSWEEKQVVNTVYDENGDILTQGYTIYRCSRCGEEYRADSGSGPPAVVDDNTSLVEGLSNLRDKLIAFFSTLPQMFGDLTQFLSEAFPYIPEDLMTLIEFSCTVAVFFGLFRLLWR